MSHSLHDGAGLVLFDGCEECRIRSGSIVRLSELDDTNLKRLASLARHRPPEMGANDRRAVEALRLGGRIVFASGITEEECR